MTGAEVLAGFCSLMSALLRSQMVAKTLTISELPKLPATKVRRIAQSFNLSIDLPGLTKGEMVGMIADRLGEDRVGWTLLDQYR